MHHLSVGRPVVQRLNTTRRPNGGSQSKRKTFEVRSLLPASARPTSGRIDSLGYVALCGRLSAPSPTKSGGSIRPGRHATV